MSSPEIDIAILKTEVEYLKGHLHEIRQDTKDIKETLSQAKGGWKTLMLVAGISSSVGALAAKFLPFFGFMPK